MITTLIGKTFIKAYNDAYGKDYTAKDFFEKEYFECFFNHSKYMQWITNSPFVQGITTDDYGNYGLVMDTVKISESEKFTKILNEAISTLGKNRVSIRTEKAKGNIKILLKNDELQRQDRLKKFNGNILQGARDGSIALGYPASEENGYGTYSGLVSNIEIDTTAEDVYYSWIGAGLAIGVSGGYSILINDTEILLKTFDGWKFYRKYLNDLTLEKLSGNKINSWNGQWLTYRLSKQYIPDFDFNSLSNQKFFKLDQNELVINLASWSELFFSLSYSFPNKALNTYICSLGDVNKTVGFIPMYLKSGKRLRDVFKQLFHSDKAFENKEFQSLFGMHIKRACELGNIGLHALRPESLKKYMNEDKNISFKKEEDTINYQSYKTWLVAMLSKNKEEITDYTLKIADVFLKYRNAGKGNSRITLLDKELFESKSKKSFLESLTTIIQDIDKSFLDELKSLRDEIHLMNNEEFGYFITLLKFDYVFIQKKS